MSVHKKGLSKFNVCPLYTSNNKNSKYNYLIELLVFFPCFYKAKIEEHDDFKLNCDNKGYYLIMRKLKNMDNLFHDLSIVYISVWMFFLQ